MYETFEIRVRKGTFDNLDPREWAEIEPEVYRNLDPWYGSQEPERVARALASRPGVWEVRWNWGGNVAGIGQGHYVPGTEYLNRYPFLKEREG